MTRPTQKTTERNQAECFFRCLFGVENALIVVDHERPDVLVRGDQLAEFGGAGVNAVGVEVCEYHPAAFGCGSFPRTEVNSRWENELLPTIEAAKRAKPALRNVHAVIDFHDAQLPKRRDHRAIAEDFVRAVEALLPRIPVSQPMQVYFFDKATLSKMHDMHFSVPGWTFLASEHFPLAAKHFNLIRLESDPEYEWPSCLCPRLIAGWNAPASMEFSRILVEKARKAAGYDCQGRPLWLLIVTEFADDPESHVFPREKDDFAYLREQIAATRFDFAAGPFQQVWLFSEFAQTCVRLYPD